MRSFPNPKRVLQVATLLMVCVAASTAFGATTYSNIDQMSGWTSCSVCAGAGGAGPSAPHSMTKVSSPSMDGQSAKFSLGGSTPYSNALWWKQLGARDTAANFVYDLYYYIKNPSAAQALEFDVNQSRSGKKYIFGTECDFKNTKVWKVYDPYNRKWRTTSIGCSVPKAYTWHHVTLEFHRGSTPSTKFISVTINGSKHYFNRSYAPRSSGAREINVAFQMDGNKYQTDYSVWVDKIKLTYW
ncbi:MAG: hypothetical protein L0Z53_08105 [Acidobacteriales bacterium]|nr:hypothetical protein [Terriglobales bacterium]